MLRDFFIRLLTHFEETRVSSGLQSSDPVIPVVPEETQYMKCGGEIS